jgi:hypothetical protein
LERRPWPPRRTSRGGLGKSGLADLALSLALEAFMAARRMAALGFKTHTGWAAAVALSGPPLEPVVILKRRVEMEARFEAGAVYHAAQGLPFGEADALIRSSEDKFGRVARVAIAAIVAELRAEELEPVASAVIGGGAKRLPNLEVILRSHALVHAAEGALFRGIVARASEGCGIRAAFLPAKELLLRAARALALSEPQVLSKLAAAGKAAGRPWAQDQKESALAAWVTIAEARPW